MAYRKLSSFIFFFILLISSCRPAIKDPEDAGLFAEFSDVVIDTTLNRAEYKAKNIKILFVHAIATDPKKGRWSGTRLKTFFTSPKPYGNGWDRYGYNYYIDIDGKVYDITPINSNTKLEFDELTYNASGYNSVSMAISLEGGCEYKNGKLLPKDNFTPVQIKKLEELIIKYKKQIPNLQVLPHNAVNKGKACPVLDVTKLKI